MHGLPLQLELTTVAILFLIAHNAYNEHGYDHSLCMDIGIDIGIETGVWLRCMVGCRCRWTIAHMALWGMVRSHFSFYLAAGSLATSVLSSSLSGVCMCMCVLCHGEYLVLCLWVWLIS
jgi:hypothetical protein